MNRGELARWGEEQASKYLSEQGLRILARNFHSPRGEIDIVALGEDCLIFIEVKARQSMKYGLPQESIPNWKQQRLIRAARWFMTHHNIPEERYFVRFDLITLYVVAGNHHLEWYKDIINLS